jgi:tRNA 2-(methylsulfanyl)-N6-isopentenyladenosine37 hydroxylase
MLSSEGIFMRAESAAGSPGIESVLGFLRCRTPSTWASAAAADIDTLLLDHASLELKAAEQAQKLIRRYGAGRVPIDDAFRSRLANRMSRLAREELRHFEQVVALIERRGRSYSAVSPSRYAGRLHELARGKEPEALVDSLVIGAVIEARSCERFFCLIEAPGLVDEPIARFYASLLRSEARHFEDYLALAKGIAGSDVADRIGVFLARDAELIASGDTELRFLGGVPASGR